MSNDYLTMRPIDSIDHYGPITCRAAEGWKASGSGTSDLISARCLKSLA